MSSKLTPAEKDQLANLIRSTGEPFFLARIMEGRGELLSDKDERALQSPPESTSSEESERLRELVDAALTKAFQTDTVANPRSVYRWIEKVEFIRSDASLLSEIVQSWSSKNWDSVEAN